MNWSVYIILCSDGSLYTGITTDVPRRFAQHASQQGAKYFRGRQPKQLLYVENNHNRSSASQRENKIKKLTRKEKWQLVRPEINPLPSVKNYHNIAENTTFKCSGSEKNDTGMG
ncbi:MAG: GIY-YIG nuclease family protein [Methylovulum sp.]|nr:GIY-YIG nuclease family protein [Methylovulum sp.]